MMRLLLFAGGMRREGWMTLDANASKGADFVATIPPIPPEVKRVGWEEIEWIHGVTSLYPWQALEAVKGLRAALVPGGCLVMEQPDAAQCDPVARPEWLFGDPAPQDPLHMNKWAYTPQSLAKLLTDVGFSKVLIRPAQHHLPQRDFRIEAYR